MREINRPQIKLEIPVLSKIRPISFPDQQIEKGRMNSSMLMLGQEEIFYQTVTYERSNFTISEDLSPFFTASAKLTDYSLDLLGDLVDDERGPLWSSSCEYPINLLLYDRGLWNTNEKSFLLPPLLLVLSLRGV